MARLSIGAGLFSCVLASSVDAAVVSIDLGASGLNILGANAGLASGTKIEKTLFGLGGLNSSFILANGYGGGWGFDPHNFMEAALSGGGVTSPRNFSSGQSIDGTGTWHPGYPSTSFRFDPASGVSPDFGANSFMGFRIINGSDFYYGYFEVLWDSTTSTFEFLSAAYESTANTPIVAGAGGGGGGGGGPAIPLPGAAGLAACGLLGLGRRRRR